MTLFNIPPGVKLYAPAALSASNFAAAVPFPPETMAPVNIIRKRSVFAVPDSDRKITCKREGNSPA